jgi:hypothetical protein
MTQAISQAISQAQQHENALAQMRPFGASKKGQNMNCHQCKHRGDIPGDAHISCDHPFAMEPINRVLTPLLLLTGHVPPLMKRMNVSVDQYGVGAGWATWPINFDPTWVESCDHVESAE